MPWWTNVCRINNAGLKNSILDEPGVALLDVNYGGSTGYAATAIDFG